MTLTEVDQLGCLLGAPTTNVSRNIVPRVVDNSNEHVYTKKDTKRILKV
jgi:hypothetical protein